MKKKIFYSVLIGTLTALAANGCGSSSSNSKQQENAAVAGISAAQPDGQVEVAPPEPVPIAAEECATPEVAVKTFLDTLRAGDERKAVSLLTNKARVETHRRGMVVQPPGSPTATYDIQASKFISRNRENAEVASIWTEMTEVGSIKYDVTWILRLEPDGWRVAGMATELVPGKGQQPLNFEDPEEMQRELENAEAALAEQETNGAQQARGTDPSDAIRR